MGVLVGLAANVLEHGSFDDWVSLNERSVDRSMVQLTEIRRSDAFNITNLSVALRQLRNLVQHGGCGLANDHFHVMQRPRDNSSELQLMRKVQVSPDYRTQRAGCDSRAGASTRC